MAVLSLSLDALIFILLLMSNQWVVRELLRDKESVEIECFLLKELSVRKV
jgi:hypothetical protein